jgi:hypothetical protein
MSPLWRNLVPTLLVAAGCHRIHVDVDCRLSASDTLWHHLDGPRYAITGVSEEAEASLSFEEFSGMLENVLRLSRPDLERAPVGEPADLNLTLHYNVIDRGTGVESYPVHYGPPFGYMYWYGPGYDDRFYGFAATEVRTVHLGYRHLLFVAAWIPDPSQPAGRRTIWEGHGDLVSSGRSLKQTMPYLLVALATYYGQSTDQPVTLALDPDDERVQNLLGKGRACFTPDSRPPE